MAERHSLPDETVMAIRVERSRGAKLEDLATKFKISKSAASQIVNGKRYAHLPLVEDREDLELIRYRKALTKIAGMDGEAGALARKVLGL